MHPLIGYEVATARIADLRRQAHHDALARAAANVPSRAPATRHAPDCGQPPPRRPTAPVREAAVDVAARTGPAGRPGYHAAPTSPAGTHRDVPGAAGNARNYDLDVWQPGHDYTSVWPSGPTFRPRPVAAWRASPAATD